VDIEVAVLFEFRMKRQRIKALFDKSGLDIGAERIDFRQIVKRLWVDLTVFIDDLDPADPLDDEDASRTIEGGGDVRGVV
jgi:hypothetical protein